MGKSKGRREPTGANAESNGGVSEPGGGTAVAEAPPPATAGLELQEIPLERIDRSPYNKRIQPKESDPAIQELAQSIAKLGLLEPIIVRPVGDRAQLIVGERRTCAARLASKTTGITVIRALVGNVDDEAAYEMCTTENLQREDLTVWEEAATCHGMLEHGWDVETAAAKIGKSEAFVRRRAALVKMTKKWAAACRGEGKAAEKVASWTAGHFELIAALAPETQDEVAKFLLDGYFHPEDWEIERLRTYLADKLMVLKKAPWGLEDATLEPKAGACSACTKRSSCRPFLPSFEPDGAEVAVTPANDRCMDRACWDRKTARHWLQQLAKVHKKNPDLRVIKEPHTGCSDESEKKIEQVAKSAGVEYHKITWNTDKAKKSDKGAYQAAVVDTYGHVTGIGWYTDRRAGSNSGGGKSPTKTLAERRAQLDKRRAIMAIDKLREEILPKFSWEDFTKRFPRDYTIRLMWLIGMAGLNAGGAASGDLPTTWKDFPGIDGEISKTDQDKLMRAHWLTLQDCGLRSELINFYHPPTQEAKAIAELIGADWKGLLAEAILALPEPKSWANLKADGTPKAAGKTKVKKKGTAPAAAAEEEEVDETDE